MSLLASLTLVAVVNDAVPGAADIERVAAVLAPCTVEFDLVLVANGVAGPAALAVKALVSATPDATAVFLANPMHDDVARLVGVEHAIGDHVLFLDLLHDDPALLPALLAPLQDGYDLVVGDRGGDAGRGSMGDGLAAAYARVWRMATGTPLALAPTGLRVLSRAAALYVAGRADAELLLRAPGIGAGFPATSVVLPRRASGPAQGVRHGWSKGLGLLLSVSTMPLRGASYAAALGGVVSMLYSVYVFGVFLFKRDVAAGWTTLSLQLAAMMFVFSVVLLFLSEYVIQIHGASPPRTRRYLVVRELRSPLSRRALRLNVVDAEGRFQLGRPGWLPEA